MSIAFHLANWLTGKTGLPIEFIRDQIAGDFRHDAERVMEAMRRENRQAFAKETQALYKALWAKYKEKTQYEQNTEDYFDKLERISREAGEDYNRLKDQITSLQHQISGLTSLTSKIRGGQVQKDELAVNDQFLITVSKTGFYGVFFAFIIMPLLMIPIHAMIGAGTVVKDAIQGNGVEAVGVGLDSGLVTGIGASIGDPNNIGPKHIDVKIDIDPNKINEDEEWHHVVEYYDSIAEGYEAKGMRLQFSNQTMYDTFGDLPVYDRSAPLSDRIHMLKVADQAHAEHTAGPRNHLAEADYYAIPTDMDVGTYLDGDMQSPIVMPNVVGAEVEYGFATNYGNFLTITKDGEKIFTVGHGDGDVKLPEDKELN